MAIVEVEKLTKRFGDFKAVDEVSFEIKEGTIFGFLGPNGAGKTTTLNMLATLLPITSGTAKINGYDVQQQRSEVRKSIGMVFQDPTLDDELTAYENMDFHGRMYGMPKKEREEKIAELLELVELADRQNQRVEKFSGGMRRRLEIARGIMHSPRVLFLDEPTLGLDPQTKNHLWNYIENLTQQQRVTIILTTHYMDEADKLSDIIAIIDEGEIIALDEPEKLKEDIGGNMIRIRSGQGESIRENLAGRDWVEDINQNGQYTDISVREAKKGLAETTNILVNKNITFESAGIFTPTLEDVFLHFTGKTLREEEASAKDRLRRRKRN